MNASLGYLLGITSATEPEDTEFNKPHMALADLYIGMVAFDCKTTIRDMESSGLAELEEFQKVKEYLLKKFIMKVE